MTAERVSYHCVVLNDGTHWPRADQAAELDHLLRYGKPTPSDLLSAASVLSAYVHLTTHPAGTESILRQVRSLRRATALLDQPKGEEK